MLLVPFKLWDCTQSPPRETGRAPSERLVHAKYKNIAPQDAPRLRKARVSETKYRLIYAQKPTSRLRETPTLHGSIEPDPGCSG